MTVAVTPDFSAVLTAARDAWTEAQTEVSRLLGTRAIDTLDAWLDALT